MKLILFALSFALVALAAVKQLKILRLTDNIEKILALILLAAANIILSTYILSEFSFISAPGYLTVHTFFALASWGAQRKWGTHFKPADREIRKHGDDLPKKLLIALLSVILLTALVNLFLCVYVPPNNGDSMTYHMSRVGYWHQHGSLHHYYTHKWTQNALPPNAEILILWSVTLLKSDIAANLVQWTAYCGIGLVIYLISGILGYGRRTSLFASLIYLSLPMVVLQSSTTQNDLVVTLFALGFFYFFHSGLKQRNYNKLFLSGTALGLAVGAKLTLFFMLPALGISSLILLRIYKAKISLYVRWCVFCVVGILVFGAYNYIQNYRSYGHPVSPPQKIAGFNGEITIEKAFLNAIRYGYDACDFRGLPPPLGSYLFDLKGSLGKRYLTSPDIVNKYTFFQRFSFNSSRVYHEDVGWFGIIGFFLYFPAAAWYFFRMFHKSTIDERCLYAFIAVSFFIFICFMQKYDVFKGRYFILPMAFIAPAAVSFTKIKRKKIVITAVVCISAAAAITALSASLKNVKKPLLPVKKRAPTTILNANFYQKRAGIGTAAKQVAPFLRFMDDAVPSGSRIGHICTINDWDYSFFGRDFSREVIPIRPNEVKSRAPEIIKKNKLDFFITSINEMKAINSPDLVLPANVPKRFFRIIPADIWPGPLKMYREYANRIFHSPVVRFKTFENIGPVEGPYPHRDLPRVRWGLGPESTIVVGAKEKMDGTLISDVRNLLFKNLVLDVSINGKTVERISLDKTGKFQKIEIPIQLKKGRNEIVLKYSTWRKKKNKTKIALLYSSITIK